MIRFSDSFTIWEEWLGVRRKHVEAVVREPDRTHVLRLKSERGPDREIRLYQKRVSNIRTPVVWLVLTGRDDGRETVSDAWPIPAAIAPDLEDPLDLLRWLCEQFGAEMEIGQDRGHFFLNCVVQPKRGLGGLEHQVGVIGLGPGDEVKQHMLIRVRDSGELDVGLAFAFVRRVVALGLRASPWH